MNVSRGAIWFSVFGGAIAWLLHLLLAYVVAEFGHASVVRNLHWGGISVVAWMGIGVTVMTLGIAAVAIVVSMQQRRHHQRNTLGVEAKPETPKAFLARSAVLSNVIFTFIIAVQSIPFLFYLQP